MQFSRYGYRLGWSRASSISKLSIVVDKSEGRDGGRRRRERVVRFGGRGRVAMNYFGFE